MSAAPVTAPDLTSARAQVLLAVADDALISGHRSSHWTGVAPSLEEDLAFSTIAQDGINHADVWYQVLAGSSDARETIDALGLGRPPEGYRHAILCERPPRDFAFTLARHWAFERFDAVRLDALADSTDPDVAAVATKLLHEARYHLEHADHWFARLSRSGDEAHERFGHALAAALPEALGLFEPVPDEDAAISAGLFPTGHVALRARWLEIVGPLLHEAGYGEVVPDEQATTPADASGGRRGEHSSDFLDDVWPEMTALYRAHPGARW
jgi:ring-1,2-phenylacetyl-CoA epoxidase subunit PaaC